MKETQDCVKYPQRGFLIYKETHIPEKDINSTDNATPEHRPNTKNKAYDYL